MRKKEKPGYTEMHLNSAQIYLQVSRNLKLNQQRLKKSIHNSFRQFFLNELMSLEVAPKLKKYSLQNSPKIHLFNPKIKKNSFSSEKEKKPTKNKITQKKVDPMKFVNKAKEPPKKHIKSTQSKNVSRNPLPINNLNHFHFNGSVYTVQAIETPKFCSAIQNAECVNETTANETKSNQSSKVSGYPEKYSYAPMSDRILYTRKNTINTQSFNEILDFIEEFEQNTLDKSSIIAFLSKPRVLTMIQKDNPFRFIFLLTQNYELKHYKIDNFYIQFLDVDNRKVLNEFNIINIIHCDTKEKILKIKVKNIENKIAFFFILTNSVTEANSMSDKLNYISEICKYEILLKKDQLKNINF